MIGRAIAEKALRELKCARAANGGKLPLELYLETLGAAIESGVKEHMAEITGEPILSRMSAPQRKALFDAIVESCGYNPDEITRAKGAEITTAIRDIRLVTPNLCVEDIRGRASSWKIKHKDWTLTPTSLAKWWSDLTPPKAAIDIYLEPGPEWRDAAKLAFPSQPWVSEAPWSDIRTTHGRLIWERLGRR